MTATEYEAIRVSRQKVFGELSDLQRLNGRAIIDIALDEITTLRAQLATQKALVEMCEKEGIK